MEFTTEQVLLQGVAAHNAGNLQDAKRAYLAILRSQPKHPDANYNLGLIAISVNEVEVALPLFKTALDMNPKIEHFWVSYIDALVQANQLKEAKRAIKKAKKRGFDAARLQNLLSQSREKGDTKSPPKEQLDRLSHHYRAGRFREAEKLAQYITKKFPKNQFGWKVLGAVLIQKGKWPEALNAHQRSVELIPEDPEAHNNLGNTLQELGRLEEAQASLKEAITLKPDYAKAHSNLGITLQKIGKLDEAAASYSQAIALQPDYAEAHSNLGNTLNDLGRIEEALESYAQAISVKPGFFDAYINLSLSIRSVEFSTSKPELYAPLSQLLSNGNFARPAELAPSILSLLKYDDQIKHLLFKEKIDLTLKEATSIIKRLDKLRLLHQLMRVSPLADLQFEGLLTGVRRTFLKNLDQIQSTPELIYFLSTLSIHCFVNEFVYGETDEEICRIAKIEAKISQSIAQSNQPEIVEILCFASYRPLHQYNWCENLESLDGLKEVKKRLIEEPFFEKEIAKEIPILNEISDGVSLKVREQYEHNPYPRWEKLAVYIKAKPIAAVCDELMLQLQSENIKRVNTPIILVAGCGTGQHSIETASRFSNCHVTAVDLSLSSLAYAQRKSDELCFTNIKYLQADILHLDKIGMQFDIIESSGVLHHMDDPMAGLRVLVDLLKPGGLMNLGLYSELARRHIKEVRKEIAELSMGESEADLRKYRQSLVQSRDEKHQKLTASSDFFSLSMMRDLIFHVKEHHFNLPEIANCLNVLGLKFCGFENSNNLANFREDYGDEADIYDLQSWHKYEERKPETFAGMYQFWCQKPVV